MNGNIIDLTGQTFGKLLVLGFSHSGNPRGAHWKVRCACGTNTIARGNAMQTGNTLSCGCGKGFIKHGKRSSSVYNIWAKMIQRCYNPSDTSYKNYGGRGITVCDEWLGSFEEFFFDVGERPEGLTLERVNNNGNYEASNCKWATRREQASNMRTNVLLTFQGETMPTAHWGERFKLNPGVLRHRINDGWDILKALTKPMKKRKK